MNRMLMIDDDPMIVTMVNAYFTAKGFQVTTAKSGVEGLKKFESGAHDVVVTDLMMANGNGYEVIDGVKLSAKGKNTPVILLTADKDEPDLQNFRHQRSPDKTMTKPFDMPALERMVRAVLEDFAGKTKT
jgi:two-component system OmpR family response regulator